MNTVRQTRKLNIGDANQTFAGKPPSYWNGLIEDKRYKPIEQPAPKPVVEVTRLPKEDMDELKMMLNGDSHGPMLALEVLRTLSKNFDKLNPEDVVEIIESALISGCEVVRLEALNLIGAVSEEEKKKHLWRLGAEVIKGCLEYLGPGAGPIVLNAAKLVNDVSDEEKKKELRAILVKDINKALNPNFTGDQSKAVKLINEILKKHASRLPVPNLGVETDPIVKIAELVLEEAVETNVLKASIISGAIVKALEMISKFEGLHLDDAVKIINCVMLYAGPLHGESYDYRYMFFEILPYLHTILSKLSKTPRLAASGYEQSALDDALFDFISHTYEHGTNTDFKLSAMFFMQYIDDENKPSELYMSGYDVLAYAVYRDRNDYHEMVQELIKFFPDTYRVALIEEVLGDTRDIVSRKASAVKLIEAVSDASERTRLFMLAYEVVKNEFKSMRDVVLSNFNPIKEFSENLWSELIEMFLNSSKFYVQEDAARLIGGLADKEKQEQLYNFVICKIGGYLSSGYVDRYVNAVRLTKHLPSCEKKVEFLRKAMATSDAAKDEVLTYLNSLKPEEREKLTYELTKFPHLLTRWRFNRAMKHAG